MTLIHRRILLLVVILIFLLVSPVIVLYVTGWRYNFPARQLQKVGALVVESIPKKVNFYLDGKLIKKSSPLDLNNISPGTYLLKLDQSGYFSWSKPISIISKQTTKVVTVNLLRQPSLSPVITADYHLYEFSGNKIFLAASTNKKIDIINTSNFSALNTFNLSENIKQILWSKDNKKIIAQSDSDTYYLLDLEKNQISNLNSEYAIIPHNLFWSTDENDIIYSSAADGFYRINVFQKTINKSLSLQNTVFTSHNLLFVQQSDYLQVYNLANQFIDQFPISQNSQLIFMPVNSSILPILDKTSNKLVLYNLNNESYYALEQQVNFAVWNVTGDALLMNNMHEIYACNPANNSTELILRTSDQIQQSFWLVGDKYVLYNTDKNGVKIIERSILNRNSYELPLTAITDLYQGTDDHMIFALSAESVYKLIF